VTQEDLPIFFEHHLDAEATRMAAFPSRDRDAFMAHWAKIMSNETGILNKYSSAGQERWLARHDGGAGRATVVDASSNVYVTGVGVTIKYVQVPTGTPTPTPSPTATPSSTPRPTPAPRSRPTPQPRPTT
jgi:hypothetical protein